MAVKFVRLKGALTATPTFLNVYASGTIQRMSIVSFSRTNNRVEPATSGTTTTQIFGIALDYREGASDTQTRVIPFVPGQLWEIDCTNTPTTLMLFRKHALTNNLTLANTSVDQTASTGIFIAYSIGTIAIVDKTMIGEFIRAPIFDKLNAQQ